MGKIRKLRRHLNQDCVNKAEIIQYDRIKKKTEMLKLTGKEYTSVDEMVSDIKNKETDMK